MTRPLLKVGKDIKLSRVTNWYDGLLSGYAWYKHEYVYFDCVDEPQYEYKITAEEIEECKKAFKKHNIKWTPEHEWKHIFYRVYEVYPFKTPEDTLMALGSRAVWEDYVGFQNLHDGTMNSRFGTPRIDEKNRNDWLHFPKDKDITWMNNLPYKTNKESVNKDKVLGKFRVYYEEIKKLRKQGYKLIEC